MKSPNRWVIAIAGVFLQIVLGAVYDPVSDDVFVAERGKGATLNGHPVSVSGCQRATDALVSVYGEAVRSETWVLLEGVAPDRWGFGGEVRD